MDVVPSIIVLAITTLLVFRRDLTTPRAQKRRPARSRRKALSEGGSAVCLKSGRGL
jgi:hypothetical protein